MPRCVEPARLSIRRRAGRRRSAVFGWFWQVPTSGGRGLLECWGLTGATTSKIVRRSYRAAETLLGKRETRKGR
jgi:hypothetical protein